MEAPAETGTSPLDELTHALRARSKSLKHKFYKTDVKLTVDESANPPSKMLEVLFRRGRSSSAAKIRIKAWEDRWVLIDAREGGKSGWKWEFTAQGRLAGSHSWGEFLALVEAFDKLLPAGGGDCSGQRGFWEGILLTGPSGIVKGKGRVAVR